MFILVEEVNRLEEYVLKRNIKRKNKGQITDKVELEFTNFDNVDWWVIKEMLLPVQGGNFQTVSPLRGLRLLDWRALNGIEDFFLKLNPPHPMEKLEKVNRKELIQAVRVIQQLESRIYHENEQFVYEHLNPEVKKYPEEQMTRDRLDVAKEYEKLDTEEMFEKGVEELEKMKKEFFFKFKISSSNEVILQNILDFEHFLEHLRIMGRQVHIQVGKKREETAAKYHISYGKKNKNISFDPHGLIRFIQSRDPTYHTGSLSDKEYRDHLAAFDSLSEEEKSNWKVEIEYPPRDVTEQIIQNKDYIAFLPKHVVNPGHTTPDGTKYNSSNHPVAHVFGDKSKREWRSSYFSLIDSEFRSYSNHKYGNEIILFSPKSIELKSKEKVWHWTSTRRSKCEFLFWSFFFEIKLIFIFIFRLIIAKYYFKFLVCWG